MSYAFDHELAAAAAMLPGAPDEVVDVERARAAAAAIVSRAAPPDPSGVHVEDRRIGSTAGVRIYRPEVPAVPVGLLDVHGGGFILGDLEMGHAADLQLCRELGVVVASVDYRLAPEHPFPAGLDDCTTAFDWMVEHAGELGIDPGRIVLHGGSAGAGLCAALALRTRDRGGPVPAFQFLAAPQLDDRLSSPSMRTFVDTPMWNRSRAAASWRAYLGDGVPGGADVPAYAAPARARDLSGLPPAYISCMEFDPMRDEAIAYATALLAAGVSVELHLFPGTFHSSSMIAQAAVSRREAAERLAVLRRLLSGTGARRP